MSANHGGRWRTFGTSACQRTIADLPFVGCYCWDCEELRCFRELENARLNEIACAKRLSDTLTGGGATTWDEIFDAAEAAESRLTEARQQLEAAETRATTYHVDMRLAQGELTKIRKDYREAVDRWNAANALANDQIAAADARAEEARQALQGLSRGDCFCEKGIGNPMFKDHSSACLAAQDALKDSL
jgi:hypothetical protein